MTKAAAHELKIELTLNAPREKLYRCWTEPELVKKWFAPRPLTTPKVEMDVRAGGKSLIVMRTPDGQEIPNPGTYLEVVPNQKIVFTDAYSEAWVPTDGAPFMTGIVTFEDAGAGKTRYTATVRHWSAEAKAKHEEMGFVAGWTQCAKQLEELAQTI